MVTLHRKRACSSSLSISWKGLLGLFLAASVLLMQAIICEAQLKVAAKEDPATASMESGIRSLQNGRYAIARTQFSAAIKANPRSADALTWRGITENRLTQYKEAVSDFEEALRLLPNQLPAEYNLALSFIRLGQSDKAIEHLRTVVKLQPGALDPEYNLAILLEAKQATGEAVEHLRAAYKANPHDSAVYQHLLVDLLRMGRVEEAQPLLGEIQNVHSAEQLHQVGTALLEAGQFREAIQVLEKARMQSQPSLSADLVLARAYIGAQEDHKATNLLKPVETSDKTGEVFYLLGTAYLDAGATQDARDSFERAVKLNPHNDLAHYHLGLMEADVPEEIPDAIVHLREAVRLDPDNPAFGIALSKLLLQRDDAQGAKLLLQHVRAQGPQGAERDLLLGIAEITLSGSQQAVPIVLRAVEEDPSVPLSYNILGFCYLQQGELEKAAGYYKKAADLSPENRIFAHAAAVAFDRANDASQAMVYAIRAVELPRSSGEDHYLLAKLLSKSGKREDAIRELNTAISLDPDMEQSYYLLARTYMQVGDTASATQWMDKLKELKQKHERAYADARKNTKPILPSTLLQGVPQTNSESDAP
jgi:tetratricopeptide (TPR) repeat protein